MRRFMALLAGTALLAGACGGDAPDPSENPKAAFTSAIEKLGEKDALSVTLSIEATADALATLSEGDLKPEDAQKILDSSLTIAGNQADDPAESRAQFLFNLAGTDAVEMRVIGYDLYARADVPAIAEIFGQDASQLEPLARDAAAAGFGFVEDALAGEWIALKNLNQLAQGLGLPTAEPDEQQQRIIQQFTTSLKRSANVTEQGEDEAGTHLVATFPIRQLAQDFIDLSQSLTPAGIPGAQLPDVSEIPDETIDVDVWIDGDGSVSQMEFDFMQLTKFAPEGEADIPEGVDRVAMRIALAEFTGEIEVPADAVEVDPQALFGAFMGGLGGAGASGSAGGGGGAPAGDFPCEMLEGEPKEVVAQFKEECPHLQ